MKLAYLFLTNGTVESPSTKANPFRLHEADRPSPFVRVKCADNRPVAPRLGANADADRPETRWSARFEKLCLALVFVLFVSTAIACGFGVQRIQHNREKYRLSLQIKQRERELTEAKKMCRNLEGLVALYAAREFRLNGVRQTTLARPKSKSPVRG